MGKDEFQIGFHMFAGIGVLVLLWALVSAWQVVQDTRTMSRATGEVIELVERHSYTDSRETERSRITIAAIAFRVAESAEVPPVVIETTVSVRLSRYRVNDRVEVLYDAAHPEKGRAYTFGELWLAPLIGLLLGSGFVAAGVVLPRYLDAHGTTMETGRDRLTAEAARRVLPIFKNKPPADE